MVNHVGVPLVVHGHNWVVVVVVASIHFNTPFFWGLIQVESEEECLDGMENSTYKPGLKLCFDLLMINFLALFSNTMLFEEVLGP